MKKKILNPNFEKFKIQTKKLFSLIQKEYDYIDNNGRVHRNVLQLIKVFIVCFRFIIHR